MQPRLAIHPNLLITSGIPSCVQRTRTLFQDCNMSVKVNIHSSHRQYTGNTKTVEVMGRTVGECLDDLISRFPGMKKVLYHQNGKLNTLIEIYLNLESTYPEELEKPVNDGDEIQITLMLAGG